MRKHNHTNGMLKRLFLILIMAVALTSHSAYAKDIKHRHQHRHEHRHHKTSEPILSWDPAVAVGTSTIDFTINVTPDPTVASATVSIVVSPSTLAAPPVVSQDVITATVTNASTSQLVWSLFEDLPDPTATTTFPLASLSEGSYIMTVEVDTPQVNASTSKQFSF
jgi:hypothetical protein